MDIRQCARCSKLFDFRGNRFCPTCVRELDDIFLKVRQYIYDNPKTNMDDLCDTCGAEEDDVLQWLREGRLILGHADASLLTCESCRKPIHSGRYCEDCANNVIGQLEDTAQIFGQRAASSSRSEFERDKFGPKMHVDLRRK